MDPLVLDTNALADREFRHRLAGFDGHKILPAVAYTEIAMHFLAKGTPLRRLDRLLREASTVVEGFRHQDARVAAGTAHQVGDAEENFVDHLVGAHAASPPRILVTRNTDDFRFLGPRVLTPHEVRETYGF